MWPIDAVPKAASATCEITVGAPPWNGAAWVCMDSQPTPQTRKASIPDMMPSVRRAFGPFGALNALTPSEIASRPVSDAPPLANALSR